MTYGDDVNKHPWYLALFLTMLLLKPVSVAAAEGVTTFKVGNSVFHIPESNSMEGKPPFWLKWIPGLDDSSRSASIVFRNEELQREVPGYQRDIDVFGTLSVLTKEEIKRYGDSNRYKDEWYGIGSYDGRRIERWERTGWYKVFHPILTKSWTVMRQYPDPAEPLPADPLDFYVARCWFSGPRDRETAHCDTYAFFNDIAVSFSLSEANLPLIDQVRDVVKAKVMSWRKS